MVAEPLVSRAKSVLVLAHFFGPESRWIDDFCQASDLTFKKVPYPKRATSWHQRGATTPLREWLDHIGYVSIAMKDRPDCVITCFPQLTLVAAAYLKLTGQSRTRLIAWNFNLGSLTPPWKGRVAGRLLARADRFVVHASSEVASYAHWLRLPQHRFRFIPLQRGNIDHLEPSPIPKPYIVSMGSANRDYATLMDAVIGTGIKTVIIAKKPIVDSLPEHPDLVKLHGLTLKECNSILKHAHINVVPISETQTASGQVTFLTAMRMGVPTVATRSVGTIDYLCDNETGLLVPPGDPATLRSSICALWNDDPYRLRIGSAGRAHAELRFSDEAAGAHLAQVIHEVFA